MTPHSRRTDLISAICHAGERFVAIAFEWPQQLSLLAEDLSLAANQDGIVPGGGDFIIVVALRRKVVCRIRTAAQLNGKHRIAVANADVI